jgi:hypothetical protein
MIKKIKEFIVANEPKITLFIGLMLVAAISFEFGFVQGENRQDKPLLIEKPAANQIFAQETASTSTSQAQNMAQDKKITPNDPNTQPQSCVFVGSKNSNKYHIPTCVYAKNIKPENLVCFKSAEEAATKGYQPDKNCIK